MNKFILFFVCILSTNKLIAQVPSFANTLQASGTQIVHEADKFANGDMVVVGEFGGTVDFNPSATIYNLSAAGAKDIFVARYSSAGSFLWAFRVGGSDVDGAYGVRIDKNNDIIVTGYFRNTADFDPGTAVANLTANGFTGTNLGSGGDIFVAKYSQAGAYIWAFSVGGDYIQDRGECVDVDDNNNIYIAGAINPTSSGPIDFDPGVGVYNLGGAPNGHAFCAKYSSTGVFNWAFTAGAYGANSDFHKVRVDPLDTTLVVTGHFIGANVDFDPGPGVANLTSASNFNDIVLAKYSLTRNYLWAFNVGGPSTTMVDEAIDVAIDLSQNIYITGYFSTNNVDFNPGAGVNTLSNNGGNEIFVAKYAANGNYIWAKSFGGTGTDWGMSLDINGSTLITTGRFDGTVDFDPSAAILNKSSNGGNDIFVSQFDTAGNFSCAFTIGGTLNESSRTILFSASDSVVLAGFYSSSPMDFDPTASQLNATNSGAEDGFFAKYPLGCSVDTILNNYAAVLSYDSCTNSIIVDNAVGFKIGDTILMIQMKGAIIDSSNTASFGNITNYGNAGNYEENIIKTITGNTIALKNNLLRTYSIPNGKVQIVTIPQFTNYSISKTHTAMPWNGSKGGVFAINVTGTLTINDNIDVSGLGFRGGALSNSNTVNCNKTDFYYPATLNEGGQKGESISDISVAKLYGRGKLASGGGGGNSHNAGGGGGSNAGSGGQGGNQYNWNGCTSTYVPVLGGIGGFSLAYNNATNKIFLGGGGGCGHANNQGGNDGGSGGGLVYLKTNNLISNTASVVAKGAKANYAAVVNLGVNDDGGNGGGSGGTILMKYNTLTNTLAVNTNGGNGSNAHTATTPAGPGGGGGGGVLWVNQAILPITINYSALGGLNGVVPEVSNTPFNSQAGQAGQSITALQMPISNMPFVPNNFVNAGNDTTICLGQSAQLNGTGAATYVWSPAATLTNANIANPIATPTISTSYILTGTDNKGCTDRDTMNVIITPGINITILASRDTVCPGQPVTLTASGASTYSWTGGITNGVTFSPTSTRTYVVTGTDAGGCIGTKSYTIVVRDIKVIITPTDPIVCRGDTIILNASGATNYLWSPGVSLSTPLQSSTKAFPNVTTTYTVIGTDANNCKGTSSITVEVISEIDLEVSKSGDINCNPYAIQLAAKGGLNYSWSPGKLLNDSTLANPKATITKTTTFTVTSSFGSCFGTADITVYYFNSSESGLFVPNAFTPNNDGLNDCYHVVSQGKYDAYELHIFNRWGQELWDANSTNACWDGTFRGEPVPVGTYFYWLKAKGECGDVLKKGDINVIR